MQMIDGEVVESEEDNSDEDDYYVIAADPLPTKPGTKSARRKRMYWRSTSRAWVSTLEDGTRYGSAGSAGVDWDDCADGTQPKGYKTPQVIKIVGTR